MPEFLANASFYDILPFVLVGFAAQIKCCPQLDS